VREDFILTHATIFLVTGFLAFEVPLVVLESSIVYRFFVTVSLAYFDALATPNANVLRPSLWPRL
jgi:hypothetical protein